MEDFVDDIETSKLLDLLGGDDSEFRRWFLFRFTAEANIDI